MNDVERRAYQRGYQCGHKRWPEHKPPLPPEAVIAGLMTALRDLRDECDALCATLCPDDEWVVLLDPHVDTADRALAAVTAWLRADDDEPLPSSDDAMTTTKNTAYTPGPWQVHRPHPSSLPHIRNADGIYVMDAPPRNGMSHAKARQMADATLISAAPDLLAVAFAARKIIEQERSVLIDSHTNPTTGRVDDVDRQADIDEMDGALAAIDAAVSKATEVRA